MSLEIAHAGSKGTHLQVVTGATDMALDRHGDIYVSDLGAAPAGAGRILRFDNPISGTVITSMKARRPAPLRDNDHDDDDRNNDR